MSDLRCLGCGVEVPAGTWACPNRGTDDVDHALSLPVVPAADWPTGYDENPFVRYRQLLWSWEWAVVENGVSDERFCDIVTGLDGAVRNVDGHGFTVTPSRRATIAGVDVFVKDETGNVSGSHKGRHLFGLSLFLRLQQEVSGAVDRTPLAISSCGNAALAAAVVAKASERELDTFVPTDAEPGILAQLEALGARVRVCERRPGESGDPCYLRFGEAIAGGAVPFACQGPDNAVTLDGGRTLGYELADQTADRPIEKLYVQVGGGALAASVGWGLHVAAEKGVLRQPPALIAVQTEGAAPLARAWARAGDVGIDAAVAERSAAMWPWEDEPKSIAHGILDDETYDWQMVVRTMQATGGYPVVATEDEVVNAYEVGRAATGIDVDHTGTAGLAGWLHDGQPTDAGVLFTGWRRHAPLHP